MHIENRATFRGLFLALWLVLLFYSNFFISVISPYLDGKLYFLFLQSLDFLVMIMAFGLVTLTRIRAYWRVAYVRYFYWGSLLVTLYYFFGIAVNGFRDATIYYRMLCYPFFMGVVGYWLGEKYSFQRALQIFLFLSLGVVVYVYIEFFWAESLYEVINAAKFYSLKSGDDSFSLEALLRSRERRLLNLEYFSDILIHKVAGPTFNYPSTSYLVSFAFLFSVIRGAKILSLIFMSAIFILSTKAGILCVCFVVFFGFYIKRVNVAPKKVVVLASVLVVIAMMLVMNSYNNIHYYSLMSSIYNISGNFMGKGIGWGGSVTVDRVVTWEYNMLVGDSGLAIVLNMLGIVGLGLYWIYFMVSREMLIRFSLTKDRQIFMLLVMTLAVLANSVIQELAIGPYAIGICLFFLMIKVSNSNSRRVVS